MPPFRPDPIATARAGAAERRIRKERAREEARSRRVDLLADAFASDDEDDGAERRRAKNGGNESDSSSDWGDEGAIYPADEGEEEVR